jgi:gluconokinase
MPTPMTGQSIVIMGVSGAGKTTVGTLLAQHIGAEFLDGDRLHSASSIAKMSSGHPLTDHDREPWLHAVGNYLASQRAAGASAVVACSALKTRYRDIIREYADDTFFVFLDGPQNVIHERLLSREHEFMEASLLDSQLAALEPLTDRELGIRVGITSSPEGIIRRVASALDSLVSQKG